MTSIVFVDYTTPVPAAWLNDVDTATYTTVPAHTADIALRPTSATLAAAGGAALVGNTPAGAIAATTVQAAINELDTEKAVLAGLSTQVFSVATATSAAHALRLDQQQSPFRNAAVNGDMSVSQVNGTTLVTTGIATDTYVIDQHIINAATAAVTAGQSTDATGLPTGFGTNLKISGAASNTNVTHKHRIEAKDARRFASKRIAISVWLYQDSGAAMASATIKAYCPTTTADTFSALTQEGSTQTFSIANAGTITKYTQFITLGASNVSKGLEIDLDLNAALLAGKTCYIAGYQIEAVASDATVGTEFEFIPYVEQERRCQRYLPLWDYGANSSVYEAGGFANTTTIYGSVFFPVPTRIVPTVINVVNIGNFLISNASGAANTAATSSAMPWANRFSARVSFSAGAIFTANQPGIVYSTAAPAKIYLTGAQLV